MKNPASVFGTPETLSHCNELTAAQKRAVLVQWQDQLQQLQSADDEGMHSREAAVAVSGDLLQRVSRLLSAIDADTRHDA